LNRSHQEFINEKIAEHEELRRTRSPQDARDRKEREQRLSSLESQIYTGKRRIMNRYHYVEELSVLNLPWEGGGSLSKGKLFKTDFIYVIQLLDDGRFIGEAVHRDSGKIAIFIGFDTDGLIDGKIIREETLCFVEGTTKYTTVIGAGKTVFEVRKLQAEEVKAFEDSVSKLSEKSPLQKWQDVSGKFSVEARLVSFDGKMVVLEKENGMTVQLPIAKLSKIDQEVIRGKLGLKKWNPS
jgi:hypothetical protein